MRQFTALTLISNELHNTSTLNDNKKKAILYILLASFSFSLMSLCIKLGFDILFIHKVFFRQFITFLLITTLIIFRKEKVIPESSYTLKLLIIRSITGLIGILLYFYSIQSLTIADAAILHKLSPFFVIITAAFIAKEKIRKSNIPLLSTAFIGAFLIIKPQFNYTVIPALGGTAGAIFAGISYAIIRLLKNKESPYTIIFYFSLISVLVLLFPALRSFQNYTMYQWAILVGIGIFATSGQYCITLGFQSYRAGDVSLVTYSQILFSLIIGLLFLSEIPDIYSIIGGVLIFASAAVFYLKNDR